MNLSQKLPTRFRCRPTNLRFATLGFLLAFCGYLGACGQLRDSRRRQDNRRMPAKIPKSIHVIAVPALENATNSYRIEQKLTSATVHEFLTATPYKISSEPSGADAVLRGKVMNLEAVPLLFDTQSGRATTMLVTVRCEITLTQTEPQKILYHSDKFIFRNEYEISTDVKSFFEEQDPALDRLARDFFFLNVAATTENF